MQRALKRLDRIHERLNDAIKPLSDDLFIRQPAENTWSVSQILQHLCLVEQRVTRDLEKAIASPGPPVGRLKKLLPTAIVSSRLVRVKAPKAVNPLESPDKRTAVENYDRARAQLKELCAANGSRLPAATLNHPFLGKIDGVAAISFVGYHEKRHYKQIREVIRKLKQ